MKKHKLYIIRYKIVLICVLFVISCRLGFSQSISVISFKLLESDLTANTAGTMEQDQNGETAALIKVVTTQVGFTFDGGSLGIVKTKQTPGEVWVYVPHGSKRITIKHPQLGVLRDYYYPIAIEAARTYEMALATGTVQTIVQQARTSQYVVFQLTPTDAVVELNGELLKTEDGVASKMMKFGTYNYRVQAPNYLMEVGAVTIDDPNNKKVVNVILKPNFSQVTINVDNDAEIWVNGEKKGIGSWTGNLGAGTYELEAKKQGHHSTLTTKDIVVTSTPQTITLQSPIPIYGEADINSTPAMADIYIDGQKRGQTPQLIDQLLVGEHQLRISKQGYEECNKVIIIKEGELYHESAKLNQVPKEDVIIKTNKVKRNDLSNSKQKKLINAAHNYMIKGDEQSAYELYTQVDIDKLDKTSLYEFVRCSFFQGHFEDALCAAEAGAKLEPRDPVFNRLAMFSSYELKKYEVAKDYIHNYFYETDGATFSEYDYFYSGLIYEALGEHSKAVEEFKKSLNLITPNSMIKKEVVQKFISDIREKYVE